jgi:vitamin B12 transporter
MNRKVIIYCLILISVFALNLLAFKEKKDEEAKQETEQTTESTETVKTLKDQYHETIVVTASLGAEVYWNATTAVSVMTKSDIERLMQVELTDILKYIPGITSQRSGSTGKATSIRLRGASSGQTMILIDGVPLNDPALGVPNASPLTLSSVGQLEVVRGSHSPLYGSSAAGGVVNMISKKGEGPFKFTFFGEGDYETMYSGNIALQGKAGDFFYYADYQTIRSDGQRDNDNYKNNTFNFKFGFDFKEETSLTFNFHYIDSLVGIPIEIMSGVKNFDENSKQTDLSFLGSVILDLKPLEKVDSKIIAGFISTHQKFKDPADDGEEYAWPVSSKTETTALNLNFVNQIELSPEGNFVLGAEYKSLSAISTDELYNYVNFDKNYDIFGVYGQIKYKVDEDLILSASLRYDDFGEFGDSWNPRFAFSWFWAAGTRVYGSYATGFRIPSLNELYYPYYGNTALEPEENNSWEFGFEQFMFEDNMHLSLTYFNNSFTNLISYDYETFMAENINSASIKGVEIMADFMIHNNWRGSFGYTLTDGVDDSTGEELIRIPRHQFFFTLTWQIDAVKVDLLARSVSEQLDNAVDGFPLYNEGYFVVDAHLTHELVPDVGIFLKVRNLFDAEYYEVKGYPAYGQTWFIGVFFR